MFAGGKKFRRSRIGQRFALGVPIILMMAALPRLWAQPNARAKTERPVLVIQTTSTLRPSAVYAPDGSRLATGPFPLALWDLRTGRLEQSLTVGISGSRFFRPGLAGAFGFSADSRRLLVTVGSLSRRARPVINTYEVSTGDLLQRFSGDDFAAFSPDGSSVVVGDASEGSLLYDAVTGVLRRRLRDEKFLAFSPDGQTLALLAEKSLALQNTPSGETFARLPITDPQSWTRAFYHRGAVFSPDGAILTDGSRFWNPRTGKTWPLNWKTDYGTPMTFAFAPNGRTLAVGARRFRRPTEGGTTLNVPAISLWDVQTGARIGGFHALDVTGADRLHFSPDGRFLLNVGEREVHKNGSLQVRDARTGRRLQDYKDRSGGVFSPDSRHLLTFGKENIEFREARSGRILATLTLLLPADALQQTGRFSPPSQPFQTEWVVTTPDGRYDHSEGAETALQWRMGSRLLPLHTYAPTYRKQGLLETVLKAQSADG